MSEKDVEARAMAAYWREAAKALRERGDQYPQPSNSPQLERDSQGRDYVVLDNINGILAVYRIKPDGLLRRLKRWPKELGQLALQEA